MGPRCDFQRLNVQMGDLASRLDGCSVFSKLDLHEGYFQVPVAIDDIKKTAVITSFDLFEFLLMPFGRKNASTTFQRLMDRILFDTYRSCLST
jgi:hypothetical protein